ncbi:MAG TPA: SCO family protein [Caulobacterales bacterium]|nr:SCO family protein [Caulobacterales bacterium]
MSPTPEPPPRRLTGAIVPALAAAGLAGLLALWLVWPRTESTSAPEGCITQQLQAIGGPINLVDTRGQAVTQNDITADGPSVLYFGFTHCPDACPTTMYTLAQALQNPNGYDIQPVLISIDPERDTPAVMDAYVKTGGFPQGLIGLTGTPEQVRAAADAFRVVYSKSPLEGGDYTMNHTSFLYVMDRQWRTAAVMATQNATPQAVAACIAAGLGASKR